MHLGVGPDGPIPGRRVVVTGVGAVTAAGVGADVLYKALCEGVAPESSLVRHFDAEATFGTKDARRLDRFSQFSLASAIEAFEDAHLELADPERAGVIFATGVGGISTMIEQLGVLTNRGADRVSPFFIPMLMPNAGAAAVSLRFGLRGPCQTVTTACAAGTHAVTDAARLIAQGRCDVMLTGGGEYATQDIAIAGFRNMTALSRSGVSRPFDVARDGFVLGEGGAALVLESLEHATARGATIYAEILGGASTADAHHITAPGPRLDRRDPLHPPRARRRGLRALRRGSRERARDLDTAQRPRRGTGPACGVRRRRAAGHVGQGLPRAQPRRCRARSRPSSRS